MDNKRWTRVLGDLGTRKRKLYIETQEREKKET